MVNKEFYQYYTTAKKKKKISVIDKLVGKSINFNYYNFPVLPKTVYITFYENL